MLLPVFLRLFQGAALPPLATEAGGSEVRVTESIDDWVKTIENAKNALYHRVQRQLVRFRQYHKPLKSVTDDPTKGQLSRGKLYRKIRSTEQPERPPPSSAVYRRRASAELLTSTIAEDKAFRAQHHSPRGQYYNRKFSVNLVPLGTMMPSQTNSSKRAALGRRRRQKEEEEVLQAVELNRVGAFGGVSSAISMLADDEWEEEEEEGPTRPASPITLQPPQQVLAMRPRRPSVDASTGRVQRPGIATLRPQQQQPHTAR